jgi:hypothetical protein
LDIIGENVIQEANFQRKLDELNCSADVFCKLCDMSPSKWSRALRDLQPLTGPELQHVGAVIDLISGIVRDSEPIPVSFKNVQAIKTLIHMRKKGARWIPILVAAPDVVQEFQDTNSNGTEHLSSVGTK